MKPAVIRVAVLLTGLLLACHCKVKAADESTDSVAYAFGSLLAGYMLEDVPAQGPEADAFVRGLMDARNASEDRAYYYGVLNGFNVMQRIRNMAGLGAEINADNVFASLATMLRDRNTGGLTTEQANAILNRWIARTAEEVAVDTVSTESQLVFMQNMENEEGAVKYPSGIIVITITDSPDGESPAPDQTAVVTYEGRLADGTVFDATEEPIELPLNNLIKGFAEGLTKMRVGGTYRLIIPAELAYGSKGVPGAIPGNSALDFTLTLREIK